MRSTQYTRLINLTRFTGLREPTNILLLRRNVAMLIHYDLDFKPYFDAIVP